MCGARVLTVYKDAALDPVAKTDPHAGDGAVRERAREPAAELLYGLAYGSNTTPDYLPWRSRRTPRRGSFEGTGIREGESFSGHRRLRVRPHGRAADERPPDLQVVGKSPVNGFIGDDTSISTLYTAASGAQVFAAGTIAWAWGLDDFGHEDRGAFASDKLQRLTQNIIERLSEPRNPPLLNARCLARWRLV